MRRLLKSFRWRFVLVCLAAILTTGVITGAGAYRAVARLQKQEIASLLQMTADWSAISILEWLTRKREQTTDVAQSAEIVKTLEAWTSADTAEEKRRHSQALQANAEFTAATIRQAFSVSIHDPHSFETLAYHSLLTNEPADAPFRMQAASEGRDGLYVSPLLPSRIPLPDCNGNLRLGAPTLLMSAPIRGADDLLGVLVIRLDVRVIDQLLADVDKYFPAYLSHDPYLVDRSGRFLTSPAFARGTVSKEIEPFSRVVAPKTGKITDVLSRASAAMESSRGSLIASYRDYRGETVCGAWSGIKGTDWLVISEIDESEINAITRKMAAEIAVLLAVAAAIVGAGVFFAASRLLQPFRQLTTLAQRLADGDYSARAKMKRDDEVGRLACAYDDMAEQTEQTIRRYENLLKEQKATEDRFEALANGAYDLVAELNEDAAILYLSPNHRQLLGWEPELLVGSDAKAIVHPDDVEPAVERFRSGGNGQGEAAFRVRARNGEWHWIESSRQEYRTSSGERRFVLVSRDITERRKLQEQLRQATRLESVGQLAGGIAHDFNNILTGIIGFTSFVLREETDPGKVRDLEQIKALAERAAVLTGQLLAFSRKQHLNPARVNLNDLVNDAVRLLSRLIGENIEISLSLTPDVPAVMADRTQIEQTLINLAVNARDAMPAGGKLEIRTERFLVDNAAAKQRDNLHEGEYVRLIVADTGTGMDAGTLDRAFEPFFTTKEVGKGTGLGLATVYGIVMQHGGAVWAESQPGKGTQVHLCFPKSDAAPPDPPAKDDAAPRQSRETVLVVEDEPAVLDSARRILEQHGYSVLAAEKPSKAITLAEKLNKNVALLVTDVVMPEQSGPQLYRRLQAALPDLKVVFMSGYAEVEKLGNEPLLDSAPFLPKPFDPQQLADIVRQLLEDDKNVAEGR